MTDIGSMTTDEAIAHYGVAGMKWGKTRAKANGYDIRAARTRVQGDKMTLDRAKSKAAKLKDPKERAKAQKDVGKLKAKVLNNPDRVIAARLTRGEKALVLILAPAFGEGLIAGTSATSRRIERKQELGKYNR